MIFDVDTFELCKKNMTKKKIDERRRENRQRLRGGEQPVRMDGTPFKPWPFPKGASFDHETFSFKKIH